MSKKKRRPNLPSGFGSIRHLSGNRRNPWAVYPPVSEWTESGSPVTPKALAYVSTWQKGFIVLQAYHAGTYDPSLHDILDIPELETDNPDLQKVIDRILADYRIIHRLGNDVSKVTFRDVHAKWHDWKFVQDKSRSYAPAYISRSKGVVDLLGDIVDRPIDLTTKQDWQAAFDAMTQSQSTVRYYQTTVKDVFRYGVEEGLIKTNFVDGLRTTQAAANKLKGEVPATVLRKMWEDRADPIVALILMLCYTGLRIEEARTVKIDLDDMTLSGGSKTAAGKNRLIPIHPGIESLIRGLGRTEGFYTEGRSNLHVLMKRTFTAYGLPEASAHWCRHTFATMCERYDVRDADAKRMLGHALKDITTGVYSHRQIEDLREQIEKIPKPWEL